MALVSVPQYHMPSAFPWSMPHKFVPEGYQPVVEVPMVQMIISVPPLVVHVIPYFEEYSMLTIAKLLASTK